jgi:hypothetical protein
MSGGNGRAQRQPTPSEPLAKTMAGVVPAADPCALEELMLETLRNVINDQDKTSDPVPWVAVIDKKHVADAMRLREALCHGHPVKIDVVPAPGLEKEYAAILIRRDPAQETPS